MFDVLQMNPEGGTETVALSGSHNQVINWNEKKRRKKKKTIAQNQ